MCAKPHRVGGAEYGCGQCMPCRINRRRLWTARLILESLMHESNLFCTLTYDHENVPKDGSLRPRDVTLFLKRLREKLRYPVRFYLVGEYGDVNWRPHYHILLFGCFHPREVAIAWKLGYVHVGTVTSASVQYCTGYVTKAMSKKEDPRLRGKHPEFARMSLRPGIGAGAMPEVARYSDGHFVDVPAVIRMFGKQWPLGRYLRKRMRLILNRSEREPEVVSMVRVLQFQEAMKDEKVAALHKGRQKQSAWRAARLNQIQASKKGLGI